MENKNNNITFFKNLPFVKDLASVRQFIKFCVVGGTCALIGFLIYYSATAKLGIWYIYSSIVAFIITAIINFIANKFWTFGNTLKGREAYRQATTFLVVAVTGLLLNSAILYTLTDFFHINYLISWVIATGLVTFWNFTLNRFWTFRLKEKP